MAAWQITARPQLLNRESGRLGDGLGNAARGGSAVNDVRDGHMADAQMFGDNGLVGARLDERGVNVGGMHFYSKKGGNMEDEKALALTYAYTALVKTIADSGVISMDHLFSNLAGARAQLERIGEVGAAELLGSLNESLQRI